MSVSKDNKFVVEERQIESGSLIDFCRKQLILLSIMPNHFCYIYTGKKGIKSRLSKKLYFT